MTRPSWVAPVTFGLALVGTAVAVYLTIAHYTTPDVLACASNGIVNCEAVTTSPQSLFLGMPVAVLGLVWFLAMDGLCSPWAWRAPIPWIRLARQVGVWGGMGFVLWLVYAELFLIHAICLWCTVVHVVTFALFVLIVLYGADQAEAER